MTIPGTSVIIQRDCEALLVPSAVPITIPAGTMIFVTQALGGSFTVQVEGNLARIEGKDADALGAEPVEMQTAFSKHAENKQAEGPVDIEQVWAAMRTCYDPEIPVNVVDLGLIYNCKVVPDLENKANLVEIEMTLTAPGCGMGPVIAQEVENKVLSLENVTDVKVELVFEPMWNQDMMSEAAKLELGLF